MTVEKRFRRLRRVGLHERRVRLWHVHAEEVDLLPDAADHANGLAEVDLRVPGGMRQRHEGLPAFGASDPDVVPHHRHTAGIAVLVAQPLEDPLGRMPLLRRRRPVGLENGVDHRQKRPKLRLLHRLRSRVAGRQREPAHLRNRLTAQSENPRRLAPAVTLNENKMPNGGVDFHGKHPRPPP